MKRKLRYTAAALTAAASIPAMLLCMEAANRARGYGAFGFEIFLIPLGLILALAILEPETERTANSGTRGRKYRVTDTRIAKRKAKPNGKPTRLGMAIKRKLLSKHMTQNELAELAGTSFRYLNQIIYGYRSGDKYIGRIAEILGIDISKYVE